jgi:hypothetical protein
MQLSSCPLPSYMDTLWPEPDGFGERWVHRSHTSKGIVTSDLTRRRVDLTSSICMTKKTSHSAKKGCLSRQPMVWGWMGGRLNSSRRLVVLSQIPCVSCTCALAMPHPPIDIPQSLCAVCMLAWAALGNSIYYG